MSVIAHCVASMLVYDEQLIQLVFDARGVRSSQVDVYCLQWPLAGACLSWDAVRFLCRVMFADLACVAVSVWLQVWCIGSDAVLQRVAVCRHARTEHLSHSSGIAVSEPSMPQADRIVLCVAVGLAGQQCCVQWARVVCRVCAVQVVLAALVDASGLSDLVALLCAW